MIYRGIPVFPLPADVSDELEQTLNFDQGVIQIGFNAEPAHPAQKAVKRRLALHFGADSPSDEDEVESFFENLGGMRGCFWVESTTADAAVIPGEISDRVRIHGTALEVGEHVCLTAATGEKFHRQIVELDQWQGDSGNVRTVGTSGPVLVLDNPLPDPMELDGEWMLSRLLLVRLELDEITFSSTDGMSDFDLEVIELPNSYADIAARGESRPIYFYRIIKRVGRTMLYSINLTAYGRSVDAGGEHWQSAPILHRGLRLSINGIDDKVSVDMYAFPGHPFEDWLPVNTGHPVEIELLQAEIAPDGTISHPQVRFRGLAVKVKRTGYSIAVDVVSVMSFNERQVPRVYIQARDNAPLGEDWLWPRRLSDYTLVGDLKNHNPAALYVDIESSALNDRPADYLAHGWVSILSGVDSETRTIRDSEKISDSIHRLYINAPFRAYAEGMQATALAGYDRSPEQAKAKFDNYLNYGGFPKVPAENPTLKAMDMETPGKIGKK